MNGSNYGINKNKIKIKLFFCQNGCLCQKFDYFAKNDEYGQEVM